MTVDEATRTEWDIFCAVFKGMSAVFVYDPTAVAAGTVRL